MAASQLSRPRGEEGGWGGGGERCKALSGRAGSQKIQIPAGQRVKAAQPHVCLLFQVTFSDHNT